MRSKPWQSLVRKLQDEGFESPYLQRLIARVDAEQAQQDLEREIAQEIASALGRSEDLLNVALLELDVAARDHDEAMEEGTRQAQLRTLRLFNARREAALSRLRDLMIHREAVGMRRHHLLPRLYPILPRRH